MAKKTKTSSEHPTMHQDYEAENDCRTLVDAEKIRKDKDRYRAAMKKAKEQMAALKAVHKEDMKDA